MNWLVSTIVSGTLFGIVLSQTQDDARAFQCITKCEDDNGIKHAGNAMQAMSGKCRTNKKFATCIDNCNYPNAKMMCYQSEKCAKSMADDSDDDAKDKTAAELCKIVIDNKDCMLQSLEYMSDQIKSFGLKKMTDKQKKVDKSSFTGCKNIVGATVKYLDKKITFKQLSNIYAENSSSGVRSVMFVLPLLLSLLYFFNE